MKKIMFVCTGNICRSPMAHYYTQYRVKELNVENDYLIDSCGTYANTGESATKNAIIAMKEYGVDLSNHRAKNIEECNLKDYDLIICLTSTHKIDILNRYPSEKGKVFTLKEYVNSGEHYVDIDDPWGLNINVYKNCAKEIVDCVEKLLKKF